MLPFSFLVADDQMFGILWVMALRIFLLKLSLLSSISARKRLSRSSCGNLVGVVSDVVVDGDELDLHGGHPGGEGAAIELDEEADHALVGAEGRAVNDERVLWEPSESTYSRLTRAATTKSSWQVETVSSRPRRFFTWMSILGP